MAIKPILTYPNSILFNISDDIMELDGSMVDLIDTYQSIKCLGLAMPQIGYNKRAFIINAKSLEIGDDYILMINPVITYKSTDLYNHIEGCLSLPGIGFNYSRPKHITVEYLDIKFNKHTLNASDLASICIQHELDHLDGKLVINLVSPLQRMEASNILSKRKRLT